VPYTTVLPLEWRKNLGRGFTVSYGLTPSPDERKRAIRIISLVGRVQSTMLDSDIRLNDLPDPSAEGGGRECQMLAHETATFIGDYVRGVRGPTVIHRVISDDLIQLKPIAGGAYYLLRYQGEPHLNSRYGWCRDKKVQAVVLRGWQDLWRSGIRFLNLTEPTWTAACYKIDAASYFHISPEDTVKWNGPEWILVAQR
jgi:hypothetical protein